MVDFLPAREALVVTNISADSPNLIIDIIICSSPTLPVLVLDLHPRKDLLLWPDHNKTFYEDIHFKGSKYIWEGFVRSKAIAVNVGSTLPKLLGPEVANRVLQVMIEPKTLWYSSVRCVFCDISLEVWFLYSLLCACHQN